MNLLKVILALTLTANINESHSAEIPENAYASGSNWFCNVGYKKQQNQCIEMNAAKIKQQQKQIATMRSKARNKNINGQPFSLRDIERKCEVSKYSDSYGDIECSGSKFRIVERKCEAYFSDSTDVKWSVVEIFAV